MAPVTIELDAVLFDMVSTLSFSLQAAVEGKVELASESLPFALRLRSLPSL